MKKKDHKDNSKVNNEKIVDLNTDNQKSADISEALSSDKEEQKVPVEELPLPDEKAIMEATI